MRPAAAMVTSRSAHAASATPCPHSPCKVPFTLGCPVPGMARWVTTSIYRFDPSVNWPTDLACVFKWNAGLKTFDGAWQARGH